MRITKHDILSKENIYSIAGGSTLTSIGTNMMVNGGITKQIKIYFILQLLHISTSQFSSKAPFQDLKSVFHNLQSMEVVLQIYSEYEDLIAQ